VLDLEASAGMVAADPRHLQRIFDALTLNAAEAMPDGGTFRIRTAPVQREGAGAATLIELADSGSGMDARTRSRLFEPLFTTKPAGRGTGLGLTTVHEAVQRLGGSIKVNSEPGRGTVFRICLPRLVEAPIEAPPSKTRAAHA
jgi:signal transduction histidine kinase